MKKPLTRMGRKPAKVETPPPSKTKTKAKVNKKEPKAKKSTSKSKKEDVPSLSAMGGEVLNKPLNEVINDNLLTYGTYVLEDRAIPSFQDGLKPSQRRVLWALYHALGNRPEKGYIKSARAEGATFQYHPHSGAYGTIVKLIEGTPCPLLTGYGNFGSFSKALTPPAAPRYSECKLSKFAMAMFFDKRYAKTYPRVPSYEGSSEEPVFLPAQLPIILALGVSGIALGTTTEIPSFTIDSLYHAVKLALKRPDYMVPVKTLAKTLQFSSAYGGTVTSKEEEIESLISTGIGSITWRCDYEIHDKCVHIHGFPPGWSYDNKIEAIRKISSVTEVADLSGKDGIHIRIGFKRMSEDALDAEMTKVVKLLSVRMAYRTNITTREYVEDDLVPYTSSDFEKISIDTLLARWVAFRVNREIKALKVENKELGIDLAYQKLMLLATNSLDVIFALLKKKGIDRVPALSKALKISEDDARRIWEMPVRSLDRLSADTINAKIKTIQARRAEIKSLLQTPERAVLDALKANEADLTNPVAYEV